jgi:hypothetical protein
MYPPAAVASTMRSWLSDMGFDVWYEEELPASGPLHDAIVPTRSIRLHR